MLDKLINASTNYLIRREVIDKEDRDVYEYGFYALYNNIIDITSIAILSVWLNQVPQTVFYHVTFIVMRNTAGGFHAKTHLRCFILSTMIWLFSLWGISCTVSPVICVVPAGLAVALYWAKAPLEHINSPLSVEKRKRMRTLSRFFSVVFFTAILAIALLMNESCLWIAAALTYGMASHALLMLIALSQAHFNK